MTIEHHVHETQQSAKSICTQIQDDTQPDLKEELSQQINMSANRQNTWKASAPSGCSKFRHCKLETSWMPSWKQGNEQQLWVLVLNMPSLTWTPTNQVTNQCTKITGKKPGQCLIHLNLGDAQNCTASLSSSCAGYILIDRRRKKRKFQSWFWVKIWCQFVISMLTICLSPGTLLSSWWTRLWPLEAIRF